MDYRWRVLEQTSELEMDDGQIDCYREIAQVNYFRAKTEGVSAFFSAYPVKARKDSAIEVYSLPEPTELSTTKH